MFIIREIFTAKPGQASKLARLFKESMMEEKLNVRVMTDTVGPYNTVVVETEVKSLSEWEKMMESYRRGEPDPNMNPEMAEEMSKYTEMYMSGRREIFRIEE